MKARPIDIARKLHISTSTLRHYEAWGLVPPIERAANGYRIYTEEHIAYFESIRAMYPAFGMDVVRQAMHSLMRGDADAALWAVNEAQAKLRQDKVMADKTIQLLESSVLDHVEETGGTGKWMSIGEVAAETNIPGSAIRHWEKEGLIAPGRDPDNGYRRFNRAHLRQLLLIRTLRTAVYSLEVIKQVLEEIERQDVEHARQTVRDTLQYLNKLNQAQCRGIHYLYKQCGVLRLLD
ncbi:MerR family transcriptional regulator [Paenibacillus koleovorans]|uniref:MerR family transcriptional regulator n=1 Tax=Paenibacillus koleovorans TaxID=121608 RepID=UPI000FDCC478|nr:MerR family transcriptional regulator [Paenibacillus koleovorans]